MRVLQEKFCSSSISQSDHDQEWYSFHIRSIFLTVLLFCSKSTVQCNENSTTLNLKTLCRSKIVENTSRTHIWFPQSLCRNMRNWKKLGKVNLIFYSKILWISNKIIKNSFKILVYRKSNRTVHPSTSSVFRHLRNCLQSQESWNTGNCCYEKSQTRWWWWSTYMWFPLYWKDCIRCIFISSTPESKPL